MIILTQILTNNPQENVTLTLHLTAQERTRSRHHFPTLQGEMVTLQLPRGTVLRDGDILQTETGDKLVKIIAKPEPVITITAVKSLDLIKAAYHLGNRHVAIEITPDYLRIAPDSVLKNMLEHLGLTITEDIVPFQPEIGAYGHSH